MNGAHGIGARWCVAPREILRFDFTSKRVTPAFQVAGKVLHIPLIGKILALPHKAFSQFAIPLDLWPHANNTGNKHGSTDEILARSNTLGICPHTSGSTQHFVRLYNCSVLTIHVCQDVTLAY